MNDQKSKPEASKSPQEILVMPDEFRKMMIDIGKSHHFEGIDNITPAYVNTSPQKHIGFYGWKNGKVKKEWSMDRLFENVKVCDWLDYHGYWRPKWIPEA